MTRYHQPRFLFNNFVCTLACLHASACMNDVPSSAPPPMSFARDRKRKSPSFIVDSGATVHCTNDKSLLTQVYDNPVPTRVKVADNHMVTAHAVGSATVSVRDDDGKYHELTLHNVVYHPSFANLMSVRRLWRDSRIKCSFGRTNRLKCTRTHARFTLDPRHECNVHSARAVRLSSDVLHARFGHCSEDRLRRLTEVSLNFPKHEGFHHDRRNCDACLSGGARKKAFAKRSKHRYTYFGERLSSDLLGPMPYTPIYVHPSHPSAKPHCALSFI
jgi:hypothetical protein